MTILSSVYALSQLFKDGLPKMAELKQEYATLQSQKNKLYSGYKELKEKASALQVARYNTERVLGIVPGKNDRDNSHEKRRSSGHEI